MKLLAHCGVRTGGLGRALHLETPSLLRQQTYWGSGPAPVTNEVPKAQRGTSPAPGPL